MAKAIITTPVERRQVAEQKSNDQYARQNRMYYKGI